MNLIVKAVNKVREFMNGEDRGDIVATILISALVIVGILAISSTVETGISGMASSVITFIQDAIDNAFGA